MDNNSQRENESNNGNNPVSSMEVIKNLSQNVLHVCPVSCF